MGGERKFVTVLFADIVQSSRLIADIDPEEADDRLWAVLDAITKTVWHYDGTVNQVLGDGVMALFGVPQAQEDHALRACVAAKAMHAEVAQSLAEVQAAGEPALAIRVGLSSGEVVVQLHEGEFDREEKFDRRDRAAGEPENRTVGKREYRAVGELKYRAVGEPVYLAQRMEQAAPPGSTLLSRATRALAGEKVATRPFGEVRLKPDSEPVEAFELSGVRVDGQPFQRLSQAGPVSFIGRRGDLDALHGLLDEVEGGAGRVLALTGEAGIGKSRLVFEFLESLRDRWVATATCDLLPPGLARRHGPLAWVITRLLPAGSTEGDEQLRAAVGELLQTFEIEGRYARAALQELLGLESGDPAWAGLDPPERLQVAVETVCEVVCAMSRRQPLVLVFEDFHWADSETRRFAEELAGRISSSRVLLIVTARSHHKKVWASWPSTTARDLGPLSRTQTSEFLDILLGSEPELDDVKQLLVRKTEGNPFFLEECVRALEESGDLSGAPGAHKLAVPIAQLEIPGSVHDVVAARIDTLPTDERVALLRASVIGQRVDVGLFCAIQNQTREKLLACLGRLEESGFLERTRDLPNVEYSFRHALIHDVAYGTLLKRIRRYLHARVMAAIEGRRIEQLPSKVDLLAHHAFRAEEWPKAYAYCRRAGQRKQAKSANEEAVRSFENALHAASMIPETRRFQGRNIDLRLELIQSLFPLGRHDEVYSQLLKARKLASHIGDERRLANVASALIPYHWMRGDLETAISWGREALGIARRLKDPKFQIQVAARLGAFYVDRGDYGSARRLLTAATKKIPPHSFHDRFGLLAVASVTTRTSLARTLGELGHFQDAIKVGEEGIGIAEESGHAFSQIYAYLYVGNALLRKGDFERSLYLLSKGFELCEASRTKLLFPLSAASLGYALVRSGTISRGLGLLERATEEAKRQSIQFQLSQELFWLADAYLHVGDRVRAIRNAEDSLKHAEKNGEKGDEAWALWLLGEIHCGSNNAEFRNAEELLHRARDIALAHLMAPLMAHIEFSLGKFLRHQGHQNRARSKLESAVSRYHELGMEYWLKTANVEMAAARQDAHIHISHG